MQPVKVKQGWTVELDNRLPALFGLPRVACGLFLCAASLLWNAGAGHGWPQQLVEFKIEPPRNLLQGQQTGIALNTDLVKLKQFLTDAANFGSLLLSPATLLSQRTNPLAKPF